MDSRIKAALEDLKSQDSVNYAAAARKWDISSTTLRRRHQGKSTSRADANSKYRQRLTNVQEDTLLEYIDSLTRRNLPPTSQIVQNLAEELAGGPVGKNWTGQFIKRHSKRITSIYLRPIDKSRVAAESIHTFEQFYALLTGAIEKYNITAENIYNWDEKGFLIGRSSISKRVMSLQAYKQAKIKHVQQDGSREFISLLACICADGSVLPPALIYEGASNDLQSTWVEDLKENDKAYFAATATGWTCDQLGLSWLRKFDRDTRQKGSRRRLLLVDGHSSHVNMAFLTLADSLRILVLILPPHSTHRLQPLDVGLFSPLAKAYTKALEKYTHGGLGWVSMTKRMFWTLFQEAWSQSFTEKNIRSAFAKTGIWPLDPSITISRLSKASNPPSTPSKSITPPPPITPFTVHGLRRLIKSDPTQQKMEILERAVLRLATKFEIQSHENKGLRMAVNEEKRRRKRGKRLNLLGEEETGGPQFFSPERVLTAKTFQDSKEAAEVEKKRQKAIEKEQAVFRRQQNEAAKQEQAIQRQLRQQATQEKKEREKAEKQAAKQEKQLQKAREKQEKAALAIQRKEQAQARKNATLAASNGTRSINRSKAPAKQTHSIHKKAAITRPKVRIARQGPRPSIRMPIRTANLVEDGPADAAGGEVQITNRRGRAVKTPQRYRI